MRAAQDFGFFVVGALLGAVACLFIISVTGVCQ